MYHLNFTDKVVHTEAPFFLNCVYCGGWGLLTLLPCDQDQAVAAAVFIHAALTLCRYWKKLQRLLARATAPLW